MRRNRCLAVKVADESAIVEVDVQERQMRRAPVWKGKMVHAAPFA
jgi:hypothetical protein